MKVAKRKKIYQRMMLMIKALLDIKSFTYVIMNVLRKTFFPKNVSSYEYSIELQHRNTERKFKFQLTQNAKKNNAHLCFDNPLKV